MPYVQAVKDIWTPHAAHNIISSLWRERGISNTEMLVVFQENGLSGKLGHHHTMPMFLSKSVPLFSVLHREHRMGARGGEAGVSLFSLLS